jgi:hypothetical protein
MDMFWNEHIDNLLDMMVLKAIKMVIGGCSPHRGMFFQIFFTRQKSVDFEP